MSGELDLMLQSLNSMRVEGLLTDVILVTSSGLEIPAHKNILAARSRYFYCMFNRGTYFNLLYFELDIHSVQGSNEPGFSRFGQTSLSNRDLLYIQQCSEGGGEDAREASF